MAKPKGKILFSDTAQPTYKPKILFSEEESQPSSPQQTTGWPGVAHDISQAFQNIPSIAAQIPGEMRGIQEQYQTEPSRIGKNIAAGVGEAGIGILNAPHDIIKYLGEKKITPEWLNKYNELPFTHIPNLGVEDKMGLGEQKPGDAMLKAIPEVIGGAKGLRKVPGFRPASRHQKALTEALEKIENTRQTHSEYLGHGKEHGTRAAQEFTREIEGEFNPETGRKEGGLRQKVGSQYDKLSNDMAKKDVMIRSVPDLKYIQREIAKLGKSVTGEEKENLMKVLTSSGSKKNVSGADALASYRELKHQKGQAFKNAYTPGETISPKAREEWIKKGERLDSLEKRMHNLIGEQIGTKYLEKLKSIDKEYATQIAPLYKNPMYQQMLKHGQTSKDIMKTLHGTTPGNETLKTILKDNPELQRLVVGQKFAAAPEKLLESGEIIEPYKKLNPHISRIIKEQQQIKDIQSEKIPKLRESVQKAEKNKLMRRGAAGGVLGTIGGGASLLGVETALGRDWKKDMGPLMTLLALHRSRKNR